MSPPEIKRINSGTGHRYTIDKKPAVGVTTALKSLAKDALPYWAAKTVAQYVVENVDGVKRMLDSGGQGPTLDYLKRLPWQARDTAAVNGTDVHNLAEKLHAGVELEIPEHIAGKVSAYLDFLNDWEPEVEAVEFTVASTEPRYAGTGDSILRFPSMGRQLCDIKTGSGVYGEYALQLAAYRYAQWIVVDGELKPNEEFDGCHVIHLSDDGYELIPVEADRQAYEAFERALWLYEKEMKKDWKTRMSPLDARIGLPLEVPGA